ncbi:16S rRNA (cytidine(1402)-2'-O)-methyltransferase [Pelagibacteraceae bacterium]|nr:16S rRNA (cytidine(1402)-2'-O)-methyltransferase [Pelagibacteraceae bacterium]
MNINKQLTDKHNRRLDIVATPIGNLKDISERAINTIKVSDLVICENPKHTLKLLNKLGIKKKLISLHDYNENKVIEKLTKHIADKKIVLLSDAGSPLISDPGFKLVQYCIKNNIDISTVPGPTAIIPALQLSGMPTNEFSFIGFFPKSKSQIDEFTKKIKDSNKTTVFFVSSHKVKICIETLNKKIQKRSFSVLKELTKINEKVFRGTNNQIIKQIASQSNSTKGEFVIVVEGKSLKKSNSDNLDEFTQEIKKMLLKFSLTDVVEIVHKLTKIKKNKIYKCALEVKKK